MTGKQMRANEQRNERTDSGGCVSYAKRLIYALIKRRRRGDLSVARRPCKQARWSFCQFSRIGLKSCLNILPKSQMNCSLFHWDCRGKCTSGRVCQFGDICGYGSFNRQRLCARYCSGEREGGLRTCGAAVADRGEREKREAEMDKRDERCARSQKLLGP